MLSKLWRAGIPHEEGKYFFMAFINNFATPANIEKVMIIPPTKAREYLQSFSNQNEKRKINRKIPSNTSKPAFPDFDWPSSFTRNACKGEMYSVPINGYNANKTDMRTPNNNPIRITC